MARLALPLAVVIVLVGSIAAAPADVVVTNHPELGELIWVTQTDGGVRVFYSSKRLYGCKDKQSGTTHPLHATGYCLGGEDPQFAVGFSELSNVETVAKSQKLTPRN